jgi:hypothetical protein
VVRLAHHQELPAELLQDHGNPPLCSSGVENTAMPNPAPRADRVG